ncbi:MAG: KH domain-containing protein [Verrucomicrobia bacterium]|nr:KH domain-containing protein [Verrucomicrobiota bacterium]
MEAALAIQEFVEYVVLKLIEHPEDATVVHEQKGERHEFHIRLNQTDIGRVIGKNGHTIGAIRNLVGAAAERNGLNVAVEVDEAE